MAQERRFPSPFEIETIPGTEGWERMYPYFYLFSDDRREFEEKQLWIWDGLHLPDPNPPFSLIWGTSWQLSLSAYTTRVLAIPPANGLSVRILNGYWYQAAHAVEDPKVMEERAPLFEKRSGFYFEHWDELYKKWVPKVTGVIEELKKIEFKDLPKYEDESLVMEHVAINSGYRLIENYEKLVMNMHLVWQYHHEFLNLCYLAYLIFYEFCDKAFPGISPNTIAKMVAGIPGLVMMFQPEVEIAKLAQLAVTLGVADVFKKRLPPDDTIAELKKTVSGRLWVEAMERTKDPWFYTSSGTGYYYYEPSWIDNLSIPFDHVRGYIGRIERGEAIERPIGEVIKEKERLAKEYRELLPADEDKKAFDQAYGTLMRVYPYTENHIFYVEHWHHTIFWQKVRDLGRVLANASFFKEPEDIFLFYYTDITPMLLDLTYNWGTGPDIPPRGPAYWAKEVEWRKGVMKKFREWTPPPALGPPPEVITEPFTIQLWGITSETMDAWLAPKPKLEEITELKGFPASAGVAEGPARVIITAGELDKVQDGEILVCPITSPSWAPVFPKIKAAVTDMGGMSCHASIVSREYGLPAVVGTGYATVTIKTGDKLKVDGTTGIVTIER